MTKKIIFFAVVILVLALLYLWYRYYTCKTDEGKPCAAARQAPSRTPGGYENAPIPSFGKKVKCSFFKGRICE